MKNEMLKGKDPTQAKPCKARTILYGLPGSGKTSFAIQFPDSYYIDCEGGANLPSYTKVLKQNGAMYLGMEDGAGRLDVVLEQARALMAGDHDRKILIIDGFTRLMNNRVREERKEMLRQRKALGYNAERKPMIAECEELSAILSAADIAVMLICHAKMKWEGGEQVGFLPDVIDQLTYDLNLVLYSFEMGNKRMCRVMKSRYPQFAQQETFLLDFPAFVEKWKEQSK